MNRNVFFSTTKKDIRGPVGVLGNSCSGGKAALVKPAREAAAAAAAAAMAAARWTLLFSFTGGH
jgi:hypothetical protein